MVFAVDDISPGVDSLGIFFLSSDIVTGILSLSLFVLIVWFVLFACGGERSGIGFFFSPCNIHVILFQML